MRHFRVHGMRHGVGEGSEQGEDRGDPETQFQPAEQGLGATFLALIVVELVADSVIQIDPS